VTTQLPNEAETNAHKLPVVEVRSNVVLYLLLGVDIFLIALFFLSRPVRAMVGSELVMFDVNSEPTFITWYSIVKLFAVALLLVAVARVERGAGSKWWRHWVALAGVFLILSLDEFLQLHERLAAPTRDLFGITGGALYLAWVIPGALLVTVVALVFVRFVIAQTREVLVLIVGSAAIFIGGSLGLEVVASAGFGFHGLTSALEELCEMAGLSLFVFALLRKLRESSGPGVTVQLR
jgi:hypothetical protein